ncbi:MAG: hypothetical protein BGO78_10520 [Chloroflexi bacterium 44-23]|nr:MAG: hypothetical protein BGO78_10520 [Chloroflexi bacterium 44-23]
MHSLILPIFVGERQVFQWVFFAPGLKSCLRDAVKYLLARVYILFSITFKIPWPYNDLILPN